MEQREENPFHYASDVTLVVEGGRPLYAHDAILSRSDTARHSPSQAVTARHIVVGGATPRC